MSTTAEITLPFSTTRSTRKLHGTFAFMNTPPNFQTTIKKSANEACYTTNFKQAHVRTLLTIK